MSTEGRSDSHLGPGGRIEASPTTIAGAPASQDAGSTWLTYETFYGLRERPFSLSSDSRFFYQSPSHAPAFDDLLAGIRRREGLSVLIGDIGTGKTTLCRAVLQNLDRKTFSAIVTDPFASREDLLRVLLLDFGVLSIDDLTSGRFKSASRTELSYKLYEFLGTLGRLHALAVVIIDEAQNLSLSLLEEIRILSDSDGRETQLQVVLVGQLELRQKLKLPEMRQVDQRISVRCNLGPLSREDVTGYVAYRLQAAGGSPGRVRFTPEALDLVYQMSGGVPRLINRVCDRALSEGYLKRAAIVDAPILKASIPDVEALGATGKGMMASSPHPDWPPTSEHVDKWLTVVEHETRAAKGAATHPSVGSTQRAKSASSRASSTPPKERTSDRGSPPTLLPPTYMQKLIIRWSRRLGIAALCVATVSAVLAAVPFVVTLYSAFTQPTVPPALPPAPRRAMAPALKMPPPPEIPSAELPAAGRYIIELALFNSPALAVRVVKDLTDAGYRAHAAPFYRRSGGIRQQILLGPYRSRAEAESDLERVQQLAYRDARIVEKSPLASSTP